MLIVPRERLPSLPASTSQPDYYEDVLLPGFITASSGVQFGEPCLTGTRVPWYCGLGWVWEYLDKPKRRKELGIETVNGKPYLTRERIIALAAFHAGYEWHKSRTRRKKMTDAVRELWEQINREATRKAKR